MILPNSSNLLATPNVYSFPLLLFQFFKTAICEDVKYFKEIFQVLIANFRNVVQFSDDLYYSEYYEFVIVNFFHNEKSGLLTKGSISPDIVNFS